MSSILGSQGLVLATAMAVSAATIILFDLLKDKYFPAPAQLSENQEDSLSQNQTLRLCLSSVAKKNDKKKKKVQFAADVKDPTRNGEEYRREHREKSTGIRRSCCGTEVIGTPAMPANRMALYSGIMRNRLQRMEYSY